MALIKEILTDEGIVTLYHRIVNYSVNRESNVVIIEVGSYYNKNTRLENFQPVKRIVFNFGNIVIDTENVIEELYTLLKVNEPLFSEATDDL